MKTVNIKSLINTSLASKSNDGKNLFDLIKGLNPNEFVLSFDGINATTTLFLNESLGQYALLNPGSINNLEIVYPDNNYMIKLKVEDVIENALLGEEYDAMVDNALLSL